MGGEAGGQCVSPEAAKDSDQGGAGGDAKEKGEPGPEVARIARQTGPGCEIINIPRDRRESVECDVGKREKLSSLQENNRKISRTPGKCQRKMMNCYLLGLKV